MKKIYSLVLMAMMLLVGTNAWAVNVPTAATIGTRAELQAAIDGVTGTATVTLTLQNDFDLDGPVWLGTANLDDDAKSIFLDLNGHKITMEATTNKGYYMFVISHGELLIDNGTINLKGTTFNGTSFNESSQIFSVFGSYKSSYWTADGTSVNPNPINTMTKGYFSHLEIGENLNVIGSENVLGTAIAIDRLAKGTAPIKNTSDPWNYINNSINYQTNVRASDSYGYAYGARVDVKGKITMLGKSGNYWKTEKLKNPTRDTTYLVGYKCYGIKTNGNLASPLNTDQGGIKTKSNVGFTTDDSYFDATYDVTQHKNDTIDVPFVYVHKDAKIVTNNGSLRSTAIYSSGYAKYLIKGTCEGNVGVNIKSGKVILQDATIASTATEYRQAGSQGGASGSGSAVVLNSTSYEGGMQVTISGDTKITADAGYGIEEVVNTQTEKVLPNPEYDPTQPTSETNPETVTVKETKVTDIIFEGGTIEGGAQGAVVVSFETDAANKDANEETTITVYGANVSGDVQVGKTGDITDILPTDNNDNPTAHVTIVTDPTTGNQTLVISEGAPVPAAEKDKATVAGNTGTVNWKHLDTSTDPMAETLVTDLTLDELEINQSYAQILTVKTGAKLEVGRVILGAKAQIIVEAGAKLIVNGNQGIVAPVTSNIVLKNEEGKRSIFLFNPNVTSNRHPNATFEILSYSWRESSTNAQSEVFGIPTYTAVKSVACLDAGKYGYLQVYNQSGAWENIAFTDDVPFPYEKLDKPFAAYALTAYRAQGEPKLTFQFGGELVGNTNATLTANLKWSFFANSYTAEVDLAQFLAGLDVTAQNVDKSIYVSNLNGNGYWNWEALDAEEVAAGTFKKLEPMQGFLLNNKGIHVEDNAINYETMVYAPAVPSYTPSAPAPRRRVVANNTAKMHVVVTNEAGAYDNVKLRETENVKSVEKYMNDDVNIYATAEEKSAIFAAENLENTYLGFSTVNGGNFTINFANVEGREFTLVDHETGARVAMVEGNAYEFTAAANTVNDYRFEIVESAKLPTAIDNTEAVKSAKGIYTITGQYVGEMNVWNTLPAGVYVINGEKRVK